MIQEKDLDKPQQSEMPFAIVDGEQITELPKDLYIPPVALQVFLDAFEGPLDLLLYLIRKQNLDILDIPIADITEQYVDYINLMKELELELAGEYLLMAAMLAEIKSRLLLPIFEEIEDEERLEGDEEENVEGEVYISLPRTKENAKKFNEHYSKELGRLIIHGSLHLLGYEDETKPEKKMMTAKEDQYLDQVNWNQLYG